MTVVSVCNYYLVCNTLRNLPRIFPIDLLSITMSILFLLKSLKLNYLENIKAKHNDHILLIR